MLSGTARGGVGEVVHWTLPAASDGGAAVQVSLRNAGPIASPQAGDTHGVDHDDRPPICPRCGVTMVPAALSAGDEQEGD